MRPRRGTRATCSHCRRPAPGLRHAAAAALRLRAPVAHPRRLRLRDAPRVLPRLRREGRGHSDGPPAQHHLTDAYAWFSRPVGQAPVVARGRGGVPHVLGTPVLSGRAHGRSTGASTTATSRTSRPSAWTSSRADVGQRYLTLVYQIDGHRRRLLWVGRDRRAKTLEGFFDWFGPARTAALLLRLLGHVEALPDGGRRPRPAGGAGARPLPHHEPLLQGDRRSPVRRRPGSWPRWARRRVLKNSRWLLLKRPENLTDAQDDRLKDLVRRNLRTVSRLSAQGGLPVAVGLRVAVLGGAVSRPLVHPDDALAARPR